MVDGGEAMREAVSTQQSAFSVQRDQGRLNGIASAAELEYHLLLSAELCILDETRYNCLNTRVIELKRMLIGIIKKLRADC